MIPDRDFSKVTFKVNVSGSWANLVTCDTDRIDQVKTACETIAEAGNGAKFKILDAEGGEIESYSWDRRNGCTHWYEPKRGQS